LREALPNLERVQVYDVDAARLAAFIADLGAAGSFAVESSASAAAAMAGAHVIVTATGKLDAPIFLEPWVGEGALVLPVHSAGWEAAMIERADRLIVDDRSQFKSFLGPLYPKLREPDAELGKIVAGDAAGRTDPAERIVDFNPGIAIHDVLMAAEVLRRAHELGFGTQLTLMDGDVHR
jgi:ornithine cyclodeaminase/alanine dehydrogenase-like protein (mu-crystallin family)